MTLEAYVAYANFWYAQAYVQALTKLGQYLMPTSTIVAPPQAQHSRSGISLSSFTLLVEVER